MTVSLRAPCVPLFSFSLYAPLLLFLFIPSNHFQLACHYDRLRLPCVIRPWRFPGHFSGYMANACQCPAPCPTGRLYIIPLYLSNCFSVLQIPVSYTKVLLGKACRSSAILAMLPGSYFRLTRQGPHLNEWGKSQNLTVSDRRDTKTACME